MVMYDDPAARFEECFERAQGFTREQKFDEAIAALDDIPRQYQLRTALLALRCHIHLAARQWPQAIELAQHLTKVEPGEPAHWISWAWAARRHESISAAENILTTALALHPECATIHYNLACYACQTDRLAEARTRLEAAVLLDPASRTLAASDRDLEPLMASLADDDPLRSGADS